MAVAYTSSTSFSEGNGTSVATVSKPASTAIGDVLIAQLYIENAGEAPTIASTGDTWTPVHDIANTTPSPDMYLYVWICVVANASSTIGVTWGGGSFWRDFAVHRFTGVHTTTPQDATATENQGTSATATATGLTTVTDGAHLVMCTANFAGTTSSGWSSPLGEQNDSGNIAMASGTQASLGSSGNMTATIASSTNWCAVLLALRPDGAESPPTFVAAGTAAFTATNGATIAPGLPSGWAADDIHVMLAARSDNTAMTSLSGWDQIAALSGNNTAAQRVEIWVRRAVGGDSAPTVTFGSSTVVRGARIYGIRGVPTTGTVADNIDVQSRSDNAASATVTFTDVNTTGTNRLILALAAYEDDATTLTDLSGYTQPTQGTKVSALGNDMGLHHQYKAIAAAGAGGGTTATISGGTFTNSVNVGILIAFEPIPVGGETAAPSITLSLAPAASAMLGATAAPSLTLSLGETALVVAFATAGPSITLSLAPSARVVALATATPSITLSLGPVALGSAQATASPSITLSLAPSGLVIALAQATPSILLSLAAVVDTGGAVFTATVTPSITLSLAPVGLGIAPATATPSITLALTPNASATLRAQATPSIRLTLAPTGLRVAPATATPSIKLTLVPTGLKIGVAQATPSITLSLAPAATHMQSATASPSITLTLTASTPAAVVFEAESSLAITLALAAIAQRISTATTYTVLSTANEQGLREPVLSYRGSP